MPSMSEPPPGDVTAGATLAGSMAGDETLAVGPPVLTAFALLSASISKVLEAPAGKGVLQVWSEIRAIPTPSCITR